MALTKAQLREILSGAGADPEKVSDAVDKIIAGHTASIEALREERDSLKESASKAEALQKELDELKANDSGAELAKLKKEYDDFKVSVENEKTHKAKEEAFREILKDLGIPERHFAKICKYSDIDGLELEDGKVKNAKDLAKSIKDEWSDHIEQKSVSGAKTPTPPSGVGSGSTMTKSEIMQIKDTTQRQQALRQYLQSQLGQ